jgi:hypothetical protein
MGILGSYQTTEFIYEDDLAIGNCTSFEVLPGVASFCDQFDQPLYGPILLIESKTLDLPIDARPKVPPLKLGLS